MYDQREEGFRKQKIQETNLSARYFLKMVSCSNCDTLVSKTLIFYKHHYFSEFLEAEFFEQPGQKRRYWKSLGLRFHRKKYWFFLFVEDVIRWSEKRGFGNSIIIYFVNNLLNFLVIMVARTRARLLIVKLNRFVVFSIEERFSNLYLRDGDLQVFFSAPYFFNKFLNSKLNWNTALANVSSTVLSEHFLQPERKQLFFARKIVVWKIEQWGSSLVCDFRGDVWNNLKLYQLGCNEQKRYVAVYKLIGDWGSKYEFQSLIQHDFVAGKVDKLDERQ